MKKLIYLTRDDKKLLDEFIIENNGRGINSFVDYACELGYKTSVSAMHRYVTKLFKINKKKELKKFRFITRTDKGLLDDHIEENRYLNIKDNMIFIIKLGYQVSQSAMHRYMVGLRGGKNGR